MVEFYKCGKNSPSSYSKFPPVGTKMRAALNARQSETPKNTKILTYI